MAAASKLDSIRLAARTERGLRDENQDAMTDFRSPFGAVYLVADGMGGTQGGAEASLLTAEGYRKYLTSFPAELSNSEALQRATSATNSEIRIRSQSGDPSVAGMGSTVVLAVFSEVGSILRATLAHVGDSRAYLLRNGLLQRLTRDHSTVQRLVDNDEITLEEARNHPDANVITRALGPYEDVQIDVSEETVEVGDLLLLCSDGLCGYVDDSRIAAELLQPREMSLTADALVALALESGSTDNITLQLIEIPQVEVSVPISGKTNLFSRAISSLTGTKEATTVSASNKSLQAWVPSVLRHGASLLLGIGLGVLAANFVPGLHFHAGKEAQLKAVPSKLGQGPDRQTPPCDPVQKGGNLPPCRPNPQPSLNVPGVPVQPVPEAKAKTASRGAIPSAPAGGASVHD